MRQKYEIEHDIKVTGYHIKDLQDTLKYFSVDDIKEADDMFRDMINETNTVQVAGIIFDAADVLETFDPVAYNTYRNDYLDGVDLTELEEFKETEQELKECEEDLEVLQKELQAFEMQEEYLQGNDEDNI